MAPVVGANAKPRRAVIAGKTAWSRADVALLQKVLADVRPSIPGYWSKIAEIVGRPADQCVEQAFQIRVGRADLDDRPDREEPTAAKKARKGDIGGDDEVPVLPKSHGPRRSRIVQDFVTQRSFDSGHDFFAACESSSGMERPLEDIVLPVGQGLKSRGALPQQPLGQLTGELKLARSIVDTSEMDLCDHTFEPKGIDAFICKVQAQCRSKRARLLRLSGANNQVKRRDVKETELKRAEKLFRRIDPRSTEDVEDPHTWETGICGDEVDDEAPLAFIPVC